MDALAIILRIVRETIESTGAPPDPLQDALASAEDRIRRSLGGHAHHISRVPDLPAKVRVMQLLEAGLPPGAIVERVGVSKQYVYRIRSDMRSE